ncbi:hypothetical protein SAMN06273572_10249 [Monaibacterium marinum]|uniref:Phage tail tube protein n=1 Tax=Pontivivens marinum TaxID=1690039 RepID=A0A2C9CQ75_9RHOB|nr:hypothetical protein [Monaibacterium marinum]SOH93373.1 hypothetical protein SAMN06273572_10249 [Monaibacterium marinum]
MPRVTGDDVIVKIGDVTVTGIKEVSWSETTGTVTSSIAGRKTDHHGSGKTTMTGSIKVERYPGDAGQAGLISGAVVALKLFPDGDGSGAEQIDVDVVLTGKDYGNLGSTEFQTHDVPFANAGDIVRTAVT